MRIKGTWTTVGQALGYPQCCIESFVTLNHLDDPRRRKFQGTGFVPCATCSETKTEAQLIEEINVARKIRSRFPTDPSNWASMLRDLEELGL